MGRLEERVRELLGGAAGAPWSPDVALVRVAQELERRRFAYVGLLPASARVDVGTAALRLAFARAAVSGAAVVLVDVRGTWAEDAGATPAAPAATRVPIGAGVSLATRRPRPGARLLDDLRELVDEPRRDTPRAVVDLAGFADAGEHLAAAALLDGVAVVARAGRTTLAELDRRVRELPAARNAGVLVLE
jgi:hypothetical protein